jgi:hypothetical protein
MQRGGLDALRASLAQTVQMLLRCRKLSGSQRRLLGEQLLCFIHVFCQSAPKIDPVSASNFDPFERRVLTLALGSSELAGVAETSRARVV